MTIESNGSINVEEQGEGDLHRPICAGSPVIRRVRQLLGRAAAKTGAAFRLLYQYFKLLAETDDAFDRAARMSRDPYDPSA